MSLFFNPDRDMIEPELQDVVKVETSPGVFTTYIRKKKYRFVTGTDQKGVCTIGAWATETCLELQDKEEKKS